MRTKGYLLPEETTGHPLRCVSLLIPDALEYRAALVRQLFDLGQHYVWDGADEDQAESAAQVWRDTLQSSLTMFDDAPCPTDETGCNQFSPGAPFIQWFPNDPYNTPDLVPAGYSSPPWYLATTASNLAYGSSTLDVITTLERLPSGSLPDVLPSSGLPRFRINVTGEGEINIHLVNLVAGSLIQLTKDDDPLTIKFIDVSKDVIAIPFETLEEFVVQIEFDTPGDHHVDCIVLAWVNDSFPFLYFGAGLRQVDLCGFAAMPTVPPTMIRSDPSGCGNLEKSTDGGTTWTDIADTDFLRRDGTCAMTGGLEIYPTANQVLLTMKGAVNPYQAAKIMVVQDGAGVDRAWINPRGDMTLNADAAGYGLYLIAAHAQFDNGQGLYWKDAVGTSRLGLRGLNGQTRMNAMGAGFGFYSGTGGQVGIFGETGIFQINDASAAGASRFVVSASPNSISSYSILEANDGASKPLFGVRKGGETFHYAFDTGTSNVFDTVVVGHESSGTPGAGYGEAIKFTGKSSTTTFQPMARLMALWEVATHATRSAISRLRVSYFGGEVTVLEAGVTGAGTAKIGFLGITPSPRLAITGDHHQNPITKQIVEALALFGLVTDSTTDTTISLVNGEWMGYDLMPELLSKLEDYSYGGIVDNTSIGECLLVCEVPPEEFYCKVYDFTDEVDRAPWVIERGQVGTGFESTMADEMVFIHTAQFDVFRVIGVTIEYNQSGTSDGTILFGAYDFAGYTSTDFGLVAPGTGMQVLADYDPTYDAFTGFRIVATSTDPAQQIQITGLKVYGYDQGLYGIIEGGTDCP